MAILDTSQRTNTNAKGYRRKWIGAAKYVRQRAAAFNICPPQIGPVDPGTSNLVVIGRKNDETNTIQARLLRSSDFLLLCRVLFNG
jgi:hypothetical protein